MACFIAPMALVIITTTIQKTAKSTAEKLKLSILNTLLWGGVILLAVEHVWHAEVTLWPPFLTAMTNPTDIPLMLSEIATIGTAMTAAVAITWLTMLTATRLVPKLLTAKELQPLKSTLTTRH